MIEQHYDPRFVLPFSDKPSFDKDGIRAKSYRKIASLEKKGIPIDLDTEQILNRYEDLAKIEATEDILTPTEEDDSDNIEDEKPLFSALDGNGNPRFGIVNS